MTFLGGEGENASVDAFFTLFCKVYIFRDTTNVLKTQTCIVRLKTDFRAGSVELDVIFISSTILSCGTKKTGLSKLCHMLYTCHAY